VGIAAQPRDTGSVLRVAVVGSGPAGVYAAGALVEHGDVAVDVIDRLPCPYGLVRYGVAADHPKIKSISATLRKVLEDPAVRFLGNVEIGTQLTLQDLHRHYDAVIFACGAAVDRRLGIPGEDLPGSFSATEFVAWYNGHPDSPVDQFVLDAQTVAVIGAGNVALDVTRMLAKSADELRATDLPAHVLDVLAASRVREIHLLARRGPAQARFTTKELRDIGDLANADVVVDPDDLELDEASRQILAEDARARRNYDVLQDWAGRPPTTRPRRIRLRFNVRPVEVLGGAHVSGLREERTRLDQAGNPTGTGEVSALDVQLVLRSIGYRGRPLPDLPFEQSKGVIPNAAGRVLRSGAMVPGEYVAGWIKRGPTGVIGTNKGDARETVASLLADAPSLPPAPIPDPEAVDRLLAERHARVVPWQGWCCIEIAEAELGHANGRERTKIVGREDLLAAAAGTVTG
jgi:ferredoxin--NADP+ reductase